MVAARRVRRVTRRGGALVPRGPVPWSSRRELARSPYGGEMPEAPDDPIAYTALQRGTPVQTRDGHQFATVDSVLVDEKVSVFDGIVVLSATGTRFVDADQIDSIYTSHVRTVLSAEEAANLPRPDGSNLVEIKPGRSLADRLRRLLGRPKR